MERGNAVFEGDLLLDLTNDGAEICVKDNLFVCDREFNNAILLSLFGGNSEDDGTVDNNKGWWGNYTKENVFERKMTSRFQYASYGRALTSGSAKDAVQAAKLDLAWLIDNGIADNIELAGSIENNKTFSLSITIQKNSNDIYKNTYAFNWEAIQWHGKTRQ